MQPRPSTARRVLRHLLGLCLLPVGLVVAALCGTPGLGIRLHCVRLGLRSLGSGKLLRAFLLIVDPMDSFRYFELEFTLRAAETAKPVRYLDVSSPRLVPLLILERYPDLTADVLNPIQSDLRETVSLADALHLGTRCRARQELIENADYPKESFDLITSISVVEHIPSDTAAIGKMWELLRPGGRLLITVPCAREACEEFANLDEYALLARDAQGFVYWQRYYDQNALEQRVWSITGSPTRVRIYGEVRPGSYDENVVQKRTNPEYPYWWEPSMMGKDYREFDEIEQLPGMGVVAMEFIKPHAP
jgi:SAM-dependent methyltransferase